jgi:hypothetical protein
MQLIPELDALLDEMATHLAKQRKISYGSEGGCAYRGTGALADCKCVVGALIPDDLYKEELETSIGNIFSWAVGEDLPEQEDAVTIAAAAKSWVDHLRAKAPTTLTDNEYGAFLQACQMFHDSSHNDEERLTYQFVLQEYDAGISDEALKEAIKDRMIEALNQQPSPFVHESLRVNWWVQP